MVSVLDSGSSSPGSSTGPGSLFLFLTLTVPLSTQEYTTIILSVEYGACEVW